MMPAFCPRCGANARNGACPNRLCGRRIAALAAITTLVFAPMSAGIPEPTVQPAVHGPVRPAPAPDSR